MCLGETQAFPYPHSIGSSFWARHSIFFTSSFARSLPLARLYFRWASSAGSGLCVPSWRYGNHCPSKRWIATVVQGRCWVGCGIAAPVVGLKKLRPMVVQPGTGVIEPFHVNEFLPFGPGFQQSHWSFSCHGNQTLQGFQRTSKPSDRFFNSSTFTEEDSPYMQLPKNSSNWVPNTARSPTSKFHSLPRRAAMVSWRSSVWHGLPLVLCILKGCEELEEADGLVWEGVKTWRCQ